MDGDREISTLTDPDQWARCAHDGTALMDGGGVSLAWEAAAVPPAGVGEPAGLAFDRWGRAYRSYPGAGRVDVLDPDSAAPPTGYPGALLVPRGLAVDSAQRLYIAESCGGAVHVVDLWAERLLRRIPVRGRPLDVAALCDGAVVLLAGPAGPAPDAALVLLRGRRGPARGPALGGALHAAGWTPTRVAVRAGQPYLLWVAPGGGRAVVARPDGTDPLEVGPASDLAFGADGLLTVAGHPGQPFRRYRQDGDGWSEIEPVRAPGYDGGAVTAAPDGRTAFTTAQGLGWTAGPAARYVHGGRVIGYRLDSGAYRTRWGRIFLDACIPPGTDLRVGFLTSDEDSVPDPVPWTPAVQGRRAVRHTELTPPLPSALRLAQLGPGSRLFRRPTGREWPWAQIAPDDAFETYEAPVDAPPGRYLWVVLDLGGTARLTPRVRSLRVERPGHRLLAHLPRAFSRDEQDADFLQRYLAPAEGMLHDLDGRAALRAVLLDPTATPQEALGWLAGLLGLALDRRWPLDARRALVAQAYDLYRIRGTLACLERILRIYLPVPVAVVENWRMRGLGGAVLGTTPGGPPAPAVGGAARATATLGRFAVGGLRPGQDGYTATAHRFTVLIAAPVEGERLEVVRSIVEQHKPAHTLAEICPLGVGMRIGRSLHVDLTSVVGPGAGWGPAVVGHVRVGEDGVVGVPTAAARVGESAVMGAVRVG
ncbi:phage tail protein [Streptomyces sp. NRRL WC-3742]|uniref:phage tail protein n=1 Tax=Streptomyces sp. NRRL WC-3742 TaxID=1463934 RepID=UPI0004CC6BC3|nr:phage tail protein [Streptomyces sp. NRRL WC-3742]